MSMMDLMSTALPTVALDDNTSTPPVIGSISTPPDNTAQFSNELLSLVGSLLSQSGVVGLRHQTGNDAMLPTDEQDAESDDLAMPSPESRQQMLDSLLTVYQPPTQPLVTSLTEQSPAAELLMLNRQMPSAQPMVSDAAAKPLSSLAINAALNATPSEIVISPAMTKTAEPFSASMTQHASVSTDLLNTSFATPSSANVGNNMTQSVQSAANNAVPVQVDASDDRWPQQLQNTLGERLQVQVKNQVQHATIRLDPPDMGKIDISIQFESGRLQVHINASQGEVYRALQQVSNELRQSLTDQNFLQVNVQVSSQNSQQQSGHGHQGDASQPFILAGAQLEGDTTEQTQPRADESVLMTI